MGAVDYSPAEVERGPENGQAAMSQRGWRFPTNVRQSHAQPRAYKLKTHQPISTPNGPLSINGVITESEHIEFSFLYDNEYIQPGLALRPLSCGLVVLLAAQHSFLRPWGTQQREFFIGHTNRSIRRIVAVLAPVVVLLCLTYDCI
jgi:hypothetical protein